MKRFFTTAPFLSFCSKYYNMVTWFKKDKEKQYYVSCSKDFIYSAHLLMTQKQGFFWDLKRPSIDNSSTIKVLTGFSLSHSHFVIYNVFNVRFATHLSSFNASSNPNPKESSFYIIPSFYTICFMNS